MNFILCKNKIYFCYKDIFFTITIVSIFHYNNGNDTIVIAQYIRSFFSEFHFFHGKNILVIIFYLDYGRSALSDYYLNDGFVY